MRARNYNAIIRDCNIKGYGIWPKAKRVFLLLYALALARTPVERVIGNLIDSANGFHAPKPDLDVKQENNNPRNNKATALLCTRS